MKCDLKRDTLTWLLHSVHLTLHLISKYSYVLIKQRLGRPLSWLSACPESMRTRARIPRTLCAVMQICKSSAGEERQGWAWYLVASYISQMNELMVQGGNPVSKIRWRADDSHTNYICVCMLHVGACGTSAWVCGGQRTTSGTIPQWTFTLCYRRGFLIGLKLTN